MDTLYKPSTVLNQQITYSCYHAGNCANGGVYIQLCGWLGTEELWTGAVSDSKYQEKTGIFKLQREFSANNFVNRENLPFTNVLDKGYQVSFLVYREGKQTVYQPTFANSDDKFTSAETIFSASVAHDRSGNEQGVNRDSYSEV